MCAPIFNILEKDVCLDFTRQAFQAGGTLTKCDDGSGINGINDSKEAAKEGDVVDEAEAEGKIVLLVRPTTNTTLTMLQYHSRTLGLVRPTSHDLYAYNKIMNAKVLPRIWLNQNSQS